MFTKTAVVLCILAIATSGFSVRPSAKNTVRNAHEQLTKKIWFWEPIEENIAGNHFSGEHHLSEPINKFRSNICDPKDFNKGYVNGVDIDSACYTNVLSFFHITHP
ncbi:hypothetical protein B9Z55_028477 [Caenorhabditis nigoni]|nr:hypothetical protein B9Z55_028477 [Caenorhabditis nigoni]